MDTRSQIDQLVRCIVESIHPLRIVLFGSAARGETEPDSDLDLLIVMPEGTHRRHTAQKLYQTIRGVSVPFDLVVVTPSDLIRQGRNPGLLYHSILPEGRTLYDA